MRSALIRLSFNDHEFSFSNLVSYGRRLTNWVILVNIFCIFFDQNYICLIDCRVWFANNRLWQQPHCPIVRTCSCVESVASIRRMRSGAPKRQKYSNKVRFSVLHFQLLMLLIRDFLVLYFQLRANYSHRYRRHEYAWCQQASFHSSQLAQLLLQLSRRWSLQPSLRLLSK